MTGTSSLPTQSACVKGCRGSSSSGLSTTACNRMQLSTVYKTSKLQDAAGLSMASALPSCRRLLLPLCILCSCEQYSFLPGVQPDQDVALIKDQDPSRGGHRYAKELVQTPDDLGRCTRSGVFSHRRRGAYCTGSYAEVGTAVPACLSPPCDLFLFFEPSPSFTLQVAFDCDTM